MQSLYNHSLHKNQHCGGAQKFISHYLHDDLPVVKFGRTAPPSDEDEHYIQSDHMIPCVT